jgi:hypothetical protein
MRHVYYACVPYTLPPLHGVLLYVFVHSLDLDFYLGRRRKTSAPPSLLAGISGRMERHRLFRAAVVTENLKANPGGTLTHSCFSALVYLSTSTLVLLKSFCKRAQRGFA